MIVPIISGPSIDVLRGALFAHKMDRKPLKFFLESKDGSIKDEFPFLLDMLRRVEGNQVWRLGGKTVRPNGETVYAEGEYNCSTKKGHIEFP